jgi:UDP-N-acetylglucosamine 2-epimerase
MTVARLQQFGLYDRLKRTGIEIRSPMNYPDFIRMVARSDYVITDGGSLEEESMILKKPCILLRKRTERVEALRPGGTMLTDLNLKRARSQIRQVESGRREAYFRNPFYFGTSPSEIIKDNLLSELSKFDDRSQTSSKMELVSIPASAP